MDRPKILIIGAGAVGAVYGRHLQKGGAEVTFFVKEKHLEKLKRGIDLLCYNEKSAGIRKFEEFRLITTAREAAHTKWDQVYITISSTALRAPEFVEMIRQVDPSAIFVMLQSGIEDFEYMRKILPKAEIVDGLISIVSYQAPLPKEDLPECIAYWLPPGSPSLFAGQSGHLDKIIPIFKKGGMPAADTDSVLRNVAFATSYFMPFLAALEANHWSFAELRKSGDLKIVDRAANEAAQASAVSMKISKPFLFSFLKSPVVRLALGFQKWVVPFNLETYFQYHFTKVGDQTRMYLENFVKKAAELGLPNENLRGLKERIG